MQYSTEEEKENLRKYIHDNKVEEKDNIFKYYGGNMKIIDIFNMIARGETPPKKFLWKDEVFGLSEDNKNYIDGDGDWLFIDYEWLDMLNDEIIILETTITYKQNNIENNKQDKIEKLFAGIKYDENGNRIHKTYSMKNLADKINEIIDYINKEEK